MTDTPRQKLIELIAEHGQELCEQPRRCDALLNDALQNGHRRERLALVNALREGVATALRGSAASLDMVAVARRLTTKLHDDLGMDRALASWAIASWMQALEIGGLIEDDADDARADDDGFDWSAISILSSHNNDTQLPPPTVAAAAFTNSIGMQFVRIEPGEFAMGSDEHANAEPNHLVRITKAFHIGIFPVTQGEYEAITGDNPSGFRGHSNPVEQVRWDEAVSFCEQLSGREGVTYRLPTEAEWEYACRAGNPRKWCFGDRFLTLDMYAWHADNADSRTHAVGQKKPNAWGVFDMHGNVWEWCQDWYDDYDFEYDTRSRRGNPRGSWATIAYAFSFEADNKSQVIDPTGPVHGTERVIRGGSWIDRPKECDSASRNCLIPTYREDTVGFRCVVEASPPASIPSSVATTPTLRREQSNPSGKYLADLPQSVTPIPGARPDEPAAQGRFSQDAVLSAHQHSRQLANAHNFERAAEVLAEVPDHLRNQEFYTHLCRRRDEQKALAEFTVRRIAELDSIIERCVREARLALLRPLVRELLDFQPEREDMMALMNKLPEYEPVFTNSIGMKFAFVPAGAFRMSGRTIHLTRPFYMGAYQVTQREYQAVIGGNPSEFRGDNRPVEYVSWKEAVIFCDQLSRLAKEATLGLRYHLPSEAQWEYACRAGNLGRWCFDSRKSKFSDYAWYIENSKNQTHPVGTKKPNDWGLHDMHGNVWEWCHDWFDEDYYKCSPPSDPSGPSSGTTRVLRGGSFRNLPVDCSSGRRYGIDPMNQNPNVGFRLLILL